MGVQFWIDLQLHYDVEIETDALRGCWARHFAGDRVGRTDGSLRPVISFDDDTTGSTSGG